MELAEKMNLISSDKVTEAYFVAKMDRLDYQGSALVHAYLGKENFAEEYQTIQQKHPMFKWSSVTINQLFATVQNLERVLIVLTKRAKAYKHALQVNFPNAQIVFQSN
ncbi:hypothetical protein [Enterococcus sp. HY326]|uniref:hypothetical protein n=1 Tax=Enterococcus sp. HY326 TaxID=2971265 RepID=UPI0022404C80|nr:hypothetical protein [Enterococcus sp. HY326]